MIMPIHGIMLLQSVGKAFNITLWCIGLTPPISVARPLLLVVSARNVRLFQNHFHSFSFFRPEPSLKKQPAGRLADVQAVNIWLACLTDCLACHSLCVRVGSSI